MRTPNMLAAEKGDMSKYSDRAREYQKAIRKILMEEWDPIGVAEIPEAQDEYDAYIPHIYSQLIHHASWQEMFDNLWETETDHIGLYGNRGRTEEIVKALMKLKEEMEKDC